jgi:hypothetical protein
MSLLFGHLSLSGTQLAVIGIVAILLFGRWLPDVAKFLGKSVVEFVEAANDSPFLMLLLFLSLLWFLSFILFLSARG